MPVSWAPVHRLHARLYYTIESLDLDPSTHSAVFVTMHKEGNMLQRESSVKDFLSKFDVAPEITEKYLYEQLKYFKSGERNNALMMTVTPYLQSLNDKDLLDMAAFYSSNISTGGQAKNDTELLELGTKLYRFGDIKKQIPACTSCHSVYGDGNNLANYPSVAGQQVGYLVSSLKAYRSKERNAGEQSLVMQSIAENLTDNEIDALANYMHGLYK